MYHTQEVTQMFSSRVGSFKEDPQQNDTPSWIQMRFGEISIGSHFVYNGERLVKTGSFHAESATPHGKNDYMFGKGDLVKSILPDTFVSSVCDSGLNSQYDGPWWTPAGLMGEVVENQTLSEDVCLDERSWDGLECVINTYDKLCIAYKSYSEKLKHIIVDVSIETEDGSVHWIYKDKQIPTTSSKFGFSEMWVIPLPNLRLSLEWLKLESVVMTSCSISISSSEVILYSDQMTQSFWRSIQPGDNCYITFPPAMRQFPIT